MKINPHLPEALRLRADIFMVTGDVTSTVRELEQAQDQCSR